jgi:hypothetical protein
MGEKWMRNLLRIAPPILVLLALLPWTWLSTTNRDLPQFGKYQDDGILLIAAKSLHDAGGYRITSLPGEPYQTKYQPFYPLLLSTVWFLGEFPSNLPLAAMLQWAIITGFLLLSFALMRSFGFASWKCACMTAFLAINPWLLYWGLLPIADFFFASLVIAVFLLLRKTAQTTLWWGAIGLLCAAAFLTKLAGILILPAICLGCLRAGRILWKRILVVTIPGIVAFAGWTLWAQLHRSPVEHSVMWYYTDYAALFRNGGLPALPQIAQTNLLSLIMLAGDSVLYNLSESMLGRFAAVILLAATISGTRRLIRRTGSVEYPLFCGLLAVLLVVWIFSPNVRLAAPLMPLLAMGLWEEGEHIAHLIALSRNSKKSSDRMAAQLIRVGLVAGIAAAAFLNVRYIVVTIPQLLQADRVASVEERSVFAWCKQFLPASAVVMANNDTLLHLSTGLKAVRAVPDSVAFYRNDVAGQLDIFTRFDDFTKTFGLTHIVLTPGDFADFEPAQRKTIVEKLLTNPNHRQIFHLGATTVLAIVPQRLSLKAAPSVSSTTSGR